MTNADRAIDVLLEVTDRLTSELDLEDALKAVTDAALDLCDGEHASLRVLDGERRQLLVGARSGKGINSAPLHFRPGEGVAGWVAAHGQPAVVPDVSVDRRFVERPDQGYAIGSLVSVPLLSRGEVVGILSVSAARTDAFDRRAVGLAQLLANCAVPQLENARIARLSVIDSLTLAYNRSMLEPRLEGAVRWARTTGHAVSVLLMDLDEFKRVNDTHGHPAGDEVLAAFAALVRAQSRPSDDFVRRGGEEFVLIMPMADESAALAAAERIRSTLESTEIALPDGGAIHQTVSIGVVTWDGQCPPEELDKRADRAMYAAKAAGRNQVVSYGAMGVVPGA